MTTPRLMLNAEKTSILFDTPPRDFADAEVVPDYFHDLNLDQLVDSVTEDKTEYDLKPFFFHQLHDFDSILYRQDVFRDFRNSPAILNQILDFASTMHDVREHLLQAGRLRYVYQKESWFLEGVTIYCAGVSRFAAELDRAAPQSSGLQRISQYLTGYAASDAFIGLLQEGAKVKDALSQIVYNLHIRGGRVTVRRYEPAPDYGADVVETFQRFKQGEVEDHLGKLREHTDLNHIEEQILDCVSLLFPETFKALGDFCSQHNRFLDDVVTRFDREVQFYIAYVNLMASIEQATTSFCYPSLSMDSTAEFARNTFDIVLARKLSQDKRKIVTNDFQLSGEERILVVSGPNQGGKTTFARTFGQLHHLACIGCPIPGTESDLLIYDNLFTHFEREEHLPDQSGKLEDDLLRVAEILENATDRSVIVINEIFTSTTLKDALLLGRALMDQIIDLGSRCVYVTFVDELSRIGPATVSMVSTVDPINPADRTFRVVRKAADGLAYALAIAEKYSVTYEQLSERIKA